MLGRHVEGLITLLFLKKLITPFEKSEAYKLGIIDKDGALLKAPKTSQEKDAFTYLDRVVFVIKRLINKLPGGEMKLKYILAATLLLRGPRGARPPRPGGGAFNEMVGAGAVGGGGAGHANTAGEPVSTDKPVIRDKAIRNWKRANSRGSGMARRPRKRRRR